MTGWISVGGQVVLTSSAAFAAGLQLQALITLNNDSYTAARWQGMLFYWAILVYAMAINIWGAKLLPTANLLSGMIPMTNPKVLGLLRLLTLSKVSSMSSVLS